MIKFFCQDIFLPSASADGIISKKERKALATLIWIKSHVYMNFLVVD